MSQGIFDDFPFFEKELIKCPKQWRFHVNYMKSICYWKMGRFYMWKQLCYINEIDPFFNKIWLSDNLHENTVVWVYFNLVKLPYYLAKSEPTRSPAAELRKVIPYYYLPILFDIIERLIILYIVTFKGIQVVLFK